jgi:glycosyltransferase involved in cell wall biosynthesis
VPAGTPVVTLLNPVNAIDLGPRDHSGSRFLFVGRIWEEKGIVELLQAIGERYPLSVVGDGPRLAELAKRYPQVRFLGWLPPEQVALEMREALALILPSVYLEAFGLVVAEALALGAPVVVSDRAGAAVLVKQGINGFVVNMGQPVQLQDSCAALMDAPKASSMSRQAYLSYWRNPLSSSVYARGLLDIYQAIGKPARGNHPRSTAS